MNKAERAALATLLDSVGLGFTKCLAETKLLRSYLKKRAALDAMCDNFIADPGAADAYLAKHAVTVGDIVDMMGDVKGVSVLIDQNGVAHVLVMMTRFDNVRIDGHGRREIVALGHPVERVTKKTAAMTLDVLAAKIAAKSAREHRGRTRLPPDPKKPAKKAKAKR
jgi:uncharacterized protein YkvS